MTERVNEDPWTDEVCQYWLDQARDEAIRLRFTNEELNLYFKAHAPTEVLNYLLRARVKSRSTGFALTLKSMEFDINDYLNNQN